MPHLRSLLFILALTAAGSAAASSDLGPANANIFQLRLAAHAVAQKAQGHGGITLPELRVFDTQGREIFRAKGFKSDTLDRLEAATTHPRPLAKGSTLVKATADVSTRAGGPFDAAHLPVADFTLITYYADWCLPCSDQVAALDSWIAQHQNWKVVWLRIESDPL